MAKKNMKTNLPKKSSKKRRETPSLQNKKSQKNIKAKKVLRKKRIVKWIGIIFLIVAAIIFMCTTPIFNVKEIEVVGNNKLTEEKIKSLSGIQLNQNTFQYMKYKIINNIKEDPYVESVSIKRILPDKIQITIEERTVSFMINYLNSYVYISSQGYFLEISEYMENVPIIEGFTTSDSEFVLGNRLNVSDLESLELILQIVSLCKENEISNYITSINISDKSNISIYFEEKGKTAYIGDASNLSTRILWVKAIMEQEEGFMGEIFVNGDLNNDKVYFREHF